MARGIDILNKAKSQIGVKESPANSDNVKYNTWYYGSPVYSSSTTKYYWCMVFVQWCYYQCGISLPVRTASCGTLLNYYRKYFPKCITDDPHEGDIIIFDFPGNKVKTDHTGIFLSKTATKVTSIDGNTGNLSESNGGAVMLKTRPLSYVAAFIHPQELEEEIYMTVDEFVDKLTPEQAYKVYLKAEKHMNSLPMPEGKVKDELEQARVLGFTDATRPMAPARRYEAPVQLRRAYIKGGDK